MRRVDYEELYFTIPGQSLLTETGTEHALIRKVKVVLGRPLPRPGRRRDEVLKTVERLCSAVVAKYLEGSDEAHPPGTPSDKYEKIPDPMFVGVSYDSDSDSDLEDYNDEMEDVCDDSLLQPPDPSPQAEFPPPQEVLLDSITQTIESGFESLYLTQDGPSDLPEDTTKLAVANRVLDDLLHQLPDLEALIKNYTHLAEELPTSGKDECADTLLKVASAIELQFQQSDDISDLNLIIECYRQGLRLRSPNSKSLINCYTQLISALDRRHQILESWEDEKEARVLHTEALAISKRALDLISPGNPDYIACLVNRIDVLGMRTPSYRELTDLDQSDQNPKSILRQLPSTIPITTQIQALYHMAGSLAQRFRESGAVSNISKAIRYGEEALVLARSNDKERLPELLGRLAICHKFRLSQTGDNADMDKAIEYNRESVHPRFSYYERRPGRLICLANILCTRYEFLSDMSDVDEAIRHLLDALSSTPPSSYFYGPVLAELASVIALPCERGLPNHSLPPNTPERMDMAVMFMEEAYKAHFRSESSHTTFLINYASVLRARSRLFPSLSGMNRVIELYRKILRSSNEGHFQQASNLYNLANALQDRFRIGQNVSDMDEAISTFHLAVAELPQEHSFHGEIVAALGLACLDKYSVTKDLHDLDEALADYERAANHPTSGVSHRFNVACLWTSSARRWFHSSTLRAYSTVLSLLSRYVATSHTIETQHSRLSVTPHSLALNAASWAISEGHLETAVELLEQGRAVLWSQVGRYRTPLDRLKEINPTLAAEFRRLSALLERDVVSSCATPVGNASEYRSVSSQWDRVVDKIRALDGFSDFLKATPFTTLQKAATKGPVIIINFDKYRADAIIIQATGSPILVPLPLATQDAITSLTSSLASALKLNEEEFAKSRNSKVIGVLRQIWDIIIHPIVDKLLTTCHVSEGSRVWWCPTSSLWSLPLHAAGPYRKGERNLPDIFVSSYTPTLSSLIQSLKRETGKKARRSLSMLAVVQTQSPGEMPLPSAADERSLLKEYIPSLNLLDGEQATHDAVLTGFKQCSWVHFACHGHQDPQRPFNSSFALHDQRLPLLDIIQTQSQTAEFAFLSACHSAAVDPKLPNEGIHLAAGLQFSGFKGVVGTMWAMADADGPVVAREFYKHMFRDSEGMVDYEDAAVGLNLATKVLRRGKVPVERWINFIHVGA